MARAEAVRGEIHERYQPVWKCLMALAHFVDAAVLAGAARAIIEWERSMSHIGDLPELWAAEVRSQFAGKVAFRGDLYRPREIMTKLALGYIRDLQGYGVEMPTYNPDGTWEEIAQYWEDAAARGC